MPAIYPTSFNSADRYDAVIIGAGPAGLTCASILLDHGLRKICMIDPTFNAGRISERYCEVPSNTKVRMFIQWATGTTAFSEIIEEAPPSNAFERLKSFDQNRGCKLQDAIAVAKLLSDGLRMDPRVTGITARVHSLVKRGDTWTLPQQNLVADRVVLAPGSHPKADPIFRRYPHITPLDLDTALTPSALRRIVRAGSKVAVIGSSHSAILVLKNLFEMGSDISIVNFYRSPLLYAVYKDGWILHDNTGLKGVAAEWAKEVLDTTEGNLPPNLHRVNLKPPPGDGRNEQQIYDAELTDCTHLVSAIGYAMNDLPTVVLDGTEVRPEFDSLSGKFFTGGQPTQAREVEEVEGLYGVGIAFPERVVDLEGNVERAVGWYKFLKSVKRMAPRWLGDGEDGGASGAG